MGQMRKRGAILGGGLALLATIIILTQSYGISDIAHEAIKLQLQLIGSSIYEYHDKTGRWPTRVEDLERTSLPQRSPHWRELIEIGTNVIVWNADLKPDPKDNAGRVLAYHNKGLLAWMGRQWVCRGDLRLEYIRSKDLKALLKSERK